MRILRARGTGESKRCEKNQKKFKKLLTLYFPRGIFIKHSMGNS
ncbi:hypothetical protein HOLDEFILI_02347 [Holdemania filiformis DSM 12042]|uniref:Uncharacterized protein n=1 Tax=Holdemania filiformis DSM 12042 TaxID=545696 RepID=B9Y942_9FIRM|nr:hypothetical protein HOLDEFILI_02347 [Holdemania filiformis DSM 12042]